MGNRSIVVSLYRVRVSGAMSRMHYFFLGGSDARYKKACNVCIVHSDILIRIMRLAQTDNTNDTILVTHIVITYRLTFAHNYFFS